MAGKATGSVLMLVEDDDAIGRLVKQYLEQQDGWRVLWLRTGEEAVAELRRHPVRLIVLDVGLPGIDGFEVCRRIRGRSNVPIVMLTARDEEPDRVVGFELGADDYVPKPFSPRELEARISAILRRAERRVRGRCALCRRDRPPARLARRHGRRRGRRVDGEGVRPAHLLPRAPGHRALAGAPARHRLGDVLPRRHADGRHARRPVASQAGRRGGDPHRPRSRVQARARLAEVDR